MSGLTSLCPTTSGTPVKVSRFPPLPFSSPLLSSCSRFSGTPAPPLGPAPSSVSHVTPLPSVARQLPSPSPKFSEGAGAGALALEVLVLRVLELRVLTLEVLFLGVLVLWTLVLGVLELEVLVPRRLELEALLLRRLPHLPTATRRVFRGFVQLERKEREWLEQERLGLEQQQQELQRQEQE
ncbi:unnamed protein product [Closterium sp. NIES-64]|nr:unnamed protein product [Closterium sp. NIES-64]